MIRKLLNRIAGTVVVMLFLFQTAQGSNTSEVLVDEAKPQSQPQPQPVLPIATPEDNPAEPLAIVPQPQPVSTLPNDIIGLPTELWENYILNEWLLPERVLYVSKTFNALAQKISCWKNVAGDHEDISLVKNIYPGVCYYKDIFQSQLYTCKFVNLVLDPSLGLEVTHIDQLFDGRLSISFLGLQNSNPMDFDGQGYKRIESIVIINKLSGVLKTNTTLKSLNLTDFALKNDSALALKESLAFNTSLKELKLTGNIIDRKTNQNLKEELGTRLSLFVDEDQKF